MQASTPTVCLARAAFQDVKRRYAWWLQLAWPVACAAIVAAGKYRFSQSDGESRGAPGLGRRGRLVRSWNWGLVYGNGWHKSISCILTPIRSVLNVTEDSAAMCPLVNNRSLDEISSDDNNDTEKYHAKDAE